MARRREAQLLVAIASLTLSAGNARGYNFVLEQPGSTAGDAGTVRGAGMTPWFSANTGVGLHLLHVEGAPATQLQLAADALVAVSLAGYVQLEGALTAHLDMVDGSNFDGQFGMARLGARVALSNDRQPDGSGEATSLVVDGSSRVDGSGVVRLGAGVLYEYRWGFLNRLALEGEFLGNLADNVDASVVLGAGLRLGVLSWHTALLLSAKTDLSLHRLFNVLSWPDVAVFVGLEFFAESGAYGTVGVSTLWSQIPAVPQNTMGSPQETLTSQTTVGLVATIHFDAAMGWKKKNQFQEARLEQANLVALRKLRLANEAQQASLPVAAAGDDDDGDGSATGSGGVMHGPALGRGGGMRGAAPGAVVLINSTAPGRNTWWLMPDEKLAVGFVDGFFRTAGSSLTPAMRTQLKKDFTDLTALAEINLGSLVGVGEGILVDGWDNITMVAALLKWILVQQAVPVLKGWEYLRDPRGQLARDRAKAAAATAERAAFIRGVDDLIWALVADTGLASDLGEALGEFVAQKYAVDFATASPYEKGRMVGICLGYLGVEIALLFVGPEEIVAKIPAVVTRLGRAGTRSGTMILRVLEKIPGLRTLLAAAGRAEKAAEAGKGIEQLAHLEAWAVRRLAGLGEAELARIARLDKATVEKLLQELSGKELVELERLLGKEKLEELARKYGGREIQAQAEGKTGNGVGAYGSPQSAEPRHVTGKELRALRDEFNKKVKPAFWKQEAVTNAGKYSPQNLDLMRNGRPPFDANGNPMELHHIVPLSQGGTNDFSNLRIMTQDAHRLGPNYKVNHPRLP
jgi:hypothetical protein